MTVDCAPPLDSDMPHGALSRRFAFYRIDEVITFVGYGVDI